MSEKGKMGIRDYNYHTWTKNMVREEKDKPKGPHFAAVMFDTRSEWTPGYDAGEAVSSSTCSVIHYFAFTIKNDLETWIAEATQAKKQFFFFRVAKVGEAEIRIHVDIGLDV